MFDAEFKVAVVSKSSFKRGQESLSLAGEDPLGLEAGLQVQDPRPLCGGHLHCQAGDRAGSPWQVGAAVRQQLAVI